MVSSMDEFRLSEASEATAAALRLLRATAFALPHDMV